MPRHLHCRQRKLYRELCHYATWTQCTCFKAHSLAADKDRNLLPLMRGAWLGKPSARKPLKRRFFQLSADGASLRWCAISNPCFHSRFHWPLSVNFLPPHTTQTSTAGARSECCHWQHHWQRRDVSPPAACHRSTFVVSNAQVLAQELTTFVCPVRRSWRKYVRLFYLEAMDVDRERLTLTLRFITDPDLTLKFRDKAK